MSGINELVSKYIGNDIPTDNIRNIELYKKEEIKIDINKLVAFRKRQPFSMYDEVKKEELKDSIKINGLLESIIVRKIDNDKFEILSGHNRVECCKELGYSTISAKIVDCDDEKATLIMLDSNLCNRERILPVEKGYAYKMKNDILKNRSNASNINTLEDKSPLGIDEGHSQIHRYIRLTELIKELQNKVNSEEISIRAGVELSYLSKENQEIVNQVLEDEKIKISLIQAQKIRFKKNDINYEFVLKILKNERVKVEKFTGKIDKKATKMYKDKFKNDKEFTDLVIKLLEEYFTSESEV